MKSAKYMIRIPIHFRPVGRIKEQRDGSGDPAGWWNRCACSTLRQVIRYLKHSFSTVCLAMALLVFTGSSNAASPAVESLLQQYRQQGAGPFSPARGETLWHQEHAARNGGKPRSCTSCHGRDLTRAGKHVRTGQPIKPMAPSANPARLTDQRKIRKWFHRNCKWTLGRECSPQEKGDLLNYLINQ